MNNRENTGMTRRALLGKTVVGIAGWHLASRVPASEPLPVVGKATSVIQIWLWGGPAHLDTFDPKPAAGNDYCGPYKNPIATNVDGIQIGEMLPKLAQQADKYSIIRGMTHGSNAHEIATYMVQTGWPAGERLVYPGFGSVVSYFKSPAYRGKLPPHIVLTEPLGRASGGGFLGNRYKAFVTGGDPSKVPFEVEGIVAPGITQSEQRQRREYLNQLNTFQHAAANTSAMKAWSAAQAEAYDMILGDGAKVFDVSGEDPALREQYGKSKFGQSCLVARRLVEQGVPSITINYTGWDTHKDHFQSMRKKLPELDAGLSTLFKDLAERGLLDRTVVVWGGEFGRTPKIQWEAPYNGGRGHWGRAFSAVVAGGGFKGGHVVGQTDARGESVVARPTSPSDLIGSIYHQLGIAADAQLPLPDGSGAPAISPTATDGLLREIM